MRLLRHLLFVLGIGVAVAILSGCEAPTSFTVNSTDDQVDAVPGDGVCETADEDECTLRAAVQEANATPGPNVIELQPGATYALARVGTNEDESATGDLDVTDVLTIHGNGATIDADRVDRILDNHATLAVHELRIIDGRAIDGRAIRSSGDLSLVGATVTLNGASDVEPVIGLHLVVHGGGKLVVADSRIHLNAGNAIRITSGDAAVANTLIGYNYDFPGAVGIKHEGDLLTVLNTSILDSTEWTMISFCPGCVPIDWYLEGEGITVGGSSRLRLLSSTISDHRQGISTSPGAIVEVAGSVIERGSCTSLVTSLGYNAGDDSSCFDGSVATDRSGIDPLLVPDAIPATRFTPGVGSPLLDAIPVGTPGLCDGSPGVDQRGLPRPAGAGCDIGAIERQPTD